MKNNENHMITMNKKENQGIYVNTFKRSSKYLYLKRGCIGILLFIFLCSLFITIVSGGFMKKEYLKPWSQSYAKSYTDIRLKVCAIGILAASNHNMQPWKIKLDQEDKNCFYLFADKGKMTQKADPYARQMMISQGTFLEYVKQAGNEFGYVCDIQLFPNGVYDEANLKKSMENKPVAKVILKKGYDNKRDGYKDIFYPDTNRNAYETTKLTQNQIQSIQSVSGGQNVQIAVYQEKKEVERISEFALASAKIEARNEAAMQESSKIFRSNEYQKNQYRYGYSVEGQGASGIKKDVLQALLTIFPQMNEKQAASKNFINYTKISVEHTPAYVMILTSFNDRISQVESGMVYSQMILQAHKNQLVVQPLSQVLEEYPQMSQEYTLFHQEFTKNQETVQMLFRIGICKKQVPYSMRQDLNAFLW